jgi:hypothetical protein
VSDYLPKQREPDQKMAGREIVRPVISGRRPGSQGDAANQVKAVRREKPVAVEKAPDALHDARHQF